VTTSVPASLGFPSAAGAGAPSASGQLDGGTDGRKLSAASHGVGERLVTSAVGIR